MLIRPAEPADHDAIWSILAPICAAGETFCVATDGGRDAAFDYWFAGRGREVFVAEAEGAVVGTSYLRPNQGGGGAHVANAGYATEPRRKAKASPERCSPIRWMPPAPAGSAPCSSTSS